MEQDWTFGYVTDVAYTYGYYQELNPLRMRMVLLQAGVQAPAFGTACELGFGLGLSVNLHAAASTVHWTGTDFNPAQAGFAQEMAGVNSGGGQNYTTKGLKHFVRALICPTLTASACMVSGAGSAIATAP